MLRVRFLVLGLVISLVPLIGSLGTSPIASASEATQVTPRGDDLVRPVAAVCHISRKIRLLTSPDTSFTPGLTMSLPMGTRGRKIPVQAVKVEAGRLDAELLPFEGERGVLLQGPHKIAGISTGGRIALIVGEKEVAIAALVDDALVGRAGSFRRLSRGRVRLYDRSSGRSREVGLPEAPQLSTQDTLKVAMRGGVTSTLSSSAKGPLRLEVTNVQGELVGDLQRFEAGSPIAVHLPKAGTYYVVARELGNSDIGGALSSWVKIQVLGLAEGQAVPVEGTFLLDRGERVNLLGTEGLQLRYGSSPQYFPATSSIGLSRYLPTSVEFRDPEMPGRTAVLKLAPRIQKVRVEMGPQYLSWPGATLRLKVGIWDGSGNMKGLGEDVRIRVSINLSEVHPQWRLTKTGLVAEIHEQEGTGPWVARLVVLDKGGQIIAREILEIASR